MTAVHEMRYDDITTELEQLREQRYELAREIDSLRSDNVNLAIALQKNRSVLLEITFACGREINKDWTPSIANDCVGNGSAKA